MYEPNDTHFKQRQSNQWFRAFSKTVPSVSGSIETTVYQEKNKTCMIYDCGQQFG